MYGAVAILGALLWVGPAVAQSPPGTLDAALESTVADGLMLQSDVDWHRGDYGRAARALLIDTEFDPANVEAWAGASWLVWSWGAKESGLAILDRMVERLPDDPSALLEAGELARVQGDMDRATRWLRQAFVLDPTSEIACTRLGAALRKQQQWDEAAKVYRTLLEHHPKHPSALRFLERFERRGDMLPDGPPAPPESGPGGNGGPPGPGPRPGPRQAPRSVT
jgi:tetratricopeptide (TPR) repeat protein